MKKMSVKKLTTMGILSSLAVILSIFAYFPLVPAVPWLSYDPKDIVIVIGGFIYGPLASFLMSIIVSFLEIVFKGGSIIDVLMNVISTCAFACVASYVYKKNHTKKGAVIGLICGVLCTVFCMTLWNYIITPIYYKMPREAVVSMWLPGIILFNVLKSGINAGVTLFLYKSVVTVLRRTNLVEKGESQQNLESTLIVVGIFITLTFICIVLSIQGII
jgi:Predicted membrane protein